MSATFACTDLYCNPLSLPDLGRGICCRDDLFTPTYYCGARRDFREASDPELLWHDGVWYMYPSVSQAYVSHDLLHWEYRPLQIDRDLGYAPSVTACNGRFLLTASVLLRDKTPALFVAPTPLGPFTCLGEPRDCHGQPLQPEYLDPSLFTDDDGRLYLYWGCAPHGGGIHGVELDPENPLRARGEAVKLIDFHPENAWERYGEYHEHGRFGWVEGAAMLKHHGIYYLQYAGCGTNFRHYSLGCCRGSGPLGPFAWSRQPLAESAHGIVTGSGHGGMVHGPDGSVWQFYTCLIRRVHFFERRIGMDRVDFAADGTPRLRITSTPQSLRHGDIGMIPLSVNKPVTPSSWKWNNTANFAVDECTHTWWEPAPDDPAPELLLNLRSTFRIGAFRVIWAEPGLDYAAGITPEPVRYRLEFLAAPDAPPIFQVDRSDNRSDRNVDHGFFAPVEAQFVRLRLERGRHGLHHGVTDLTLFGYPDQAGTLS